VELYEYIKFSSFLIEPWLLYRYLKYKNNKYKMSINTKNSLKLVQTFWKCHQVSKIINLKSCGMFQLSTVNTFNLDYLFTL